MKQKKMMTSSRKERDKISSFPRQRPQKKIKKGKLKTRW